MEYVEIEINKHTIMGLIGLILGIFILISIILVFTGIIPAYGSPITTFLMMFGFFYAFYKTIIKNEKLTRGEWVAIIILLILFFLPLFLL
jgi:hypothetical protein